MAGQILGIYFKSIIGSMLASTAASLFPEHRERIAQMQDDQPYAWDEYVRMMQDLHARLSDSSLRAVAQASIMKLMPLHRAAGFSTLERVFGDFGTFSHDVVSGLPPTEAIRTVSFTPQTVVLEVETCLPTPVLSGFFQGLLTSFGRVLLSEEVTRHGPTTRFTLKWS
jgi:hypothetical protein